MGGDAMLFRVMVVWIFLLLDGLPASLHFTRAAASDIGSEGSGRQPTGRTTDDRPRRLARRIQTLERRVEALEQRTTRLQQQNEELRQDLERCGCHTRDCMDNATKKHRRHGTSWSNSHCVMCLCQNATITCSKADLPGCETHSECSCENGGVCRKVAGTIRCVCPEGFLGPRCQHSHSNPCTFLPSDGNCSAADRLQGRNVQSSHFYYDWNSQSCTAFHYSGCGGSANNFPTRRQCERLCLQGACCVRHVTNNARGTQECLDLNLEECRRRVRRQNSTNQEVVSFSAGASCDVIPCGGSPLHVWSSLCPDCKTSPCAAPPCRCSNVIERREIRDLSPRERWLFQQAIGVLSTPAGLDNNNNTFTRPWESLRDLYMRHVMHASNTRYFLLWHRLFLRVVEHQLRQARCPVAIPYYDFTSDSGRLHTASVWQANFFGGDGSGRQGCVRHHPFGDSIHWSPCIVRRFNTSLPIPSILEVAHILQAPTYEQLSQGLQGLVGYLHGFIGGTMGTTAASYDPVFLSIYAYIDMLFWRWQLRNPDGFRGVDLRGARLEPFGLTLEEALLEAAPCVTYLAPGKGCPCNLTSSDLGVFPYAGYDEDGFDSIGYDRFGYDRLGYDRDGYSRTGYDRAGYDRYAFDKDGYDRHGYDRHGFDRHGLPDQTGIYDNNNMDCFCRDRSGISKSGFDQFGYDISGLSPRGCGFGFRGPHLPRHMTEMWQWLEILPQEVIANLGRSCLPLTSVNDQWWRQSWVTEIPRITDIIRHATPVEGVYQRLCWDAAPYITSCVCPGNTVTCAADPCEGATCRADPEALCVMTTCGRCGTMWVRDGRRVSCTNPTLSSGRCLPNPCLNGGTCQPSRWRHRPDDVTCACPPHFEGDRCERRATQVCLLPADQGTCSEFEDRWYYDRLTGSCRPFRYSGCGGNANSFPTMHHCVQRCVMGACCVRTQIHAGEYGYNAAGYDRYGFSEDGQSAEGTQRTLQDGVAYGENVYDSTGYDSQGYDREGYNRVGLDSMGYGRDGYNLQGFNLTGYDRVGDYDGDITFNAQGFNDKGYNRAGFTCRGFNSDGLDARGHIAGHTFTCSRVTREACLALSHRDAKGSLTSFTPGAYCHQVSCQSSCGCQYGVQTYAIGNSIPTGCGLTARCHSDSKVHFTCHTSRKRKEIRELTTEEWTQFHTAVRRLTSGSVNQWEKLSELFSTHYPSDELLILPWLRYFIHQVESALQEVDCRVTIPYFDWTLDAGSMRTSQAWQANAFGGTGDRGSQCVVRHPFQDPYSVGWSPCLRRQFRLESPLPHILQVHHLLREHEYTTFSQQLLKMSDYFRTWVGGHAATRNAAYDPMFLSHAAFVDKLWGDWQRRNPEASYSFPANQRFAPMTPFGVSVDGVWDSNLQLCVEYVGLTFGTPCIRPSDSESDRTTQRQFDSSGYESEGYDIDGFDDRGFNRLGFGRDGFNRDTFNRFGYDRRGYNRRGFDIRGFNPQGFNLNGTHRQGSRIHSHDNIYDAAGYNRYGFNKYGFNRAGFDAFGFDARGHDDKGCSYYFNGPFYVLQFVTLCRAVDHMTLKELLEVPTHCPQLPDMTVFPEISPPQGYPPLTNGVWLPILPQKRFCTVLPAHSECALGVRETRCDVDLCTEPLCLQQQNAACWTQGCGGNCLPVWYDVISGGPLKCTGCTVKGGAVHEDTSSWRPDRCSSCTCNTGLITCVPDPPCPALSCPNPVKPPHHCCPSCDACQFGGAVYADGTQVPVPDDRCQQCACRHGNVVCQPITCPPLPETCVNSSIPHNQCCARCVDCDVTNRDTWRDDRCQLCSCQEGVIQCEQKVCPAVRCTHPATPPSGCCPRCLECYHEGRRVRDGHTWRPDSCRTCRCHHGTVRCKRMSCPAPSCDHPVDVPGECCPQCDTGCVYTKSRYSDGDTFPAPYNACLECTCRNTRVTCRPLTCPLSNLTCDHPVTAPGECCPSRCQECVHGVSAYPHGAEWEVGSCEVCSCREGVVSCLPINPCPPVPCTHGANPPGQCCPVCQDCDYKGILRSDGSTFTADEQDTCTECACAMGVVTCQRAAPCSPIRCRNPRKTPGSCCAQCQKCFRGGVSYEDGEEVPSTKTCHRCICYDGDVVCRPVTCPALTCHDVIHPVGECCPQCSDCQHEGAVYKSGQRFVSSRDPCLKCVCQSQRVTCERVRCPDLTCPGPRPAPPGQCCPLCGVSGCDHEGRVYEEGEEVPGAACETCRCVDRSVRCVRAQCPPTDCPYPVRDQCCPSCEGGCDYDGATYVDGGTFPDPRGDPCSQCTCRQGYITCERTPCPDPGCRHPATPPGACCPQCTGCSYVGRQYRNQDRFEDPTGRSCSECVCLDGNVSCTREQCLPPSCTHPLTIGVCCPTCKDCEYEGRHIPEGAVVPGDTYGCIKCHCASGSMNCQPQPCPPLTCDKPLEQPGQCCPVCEEVLCHYDGQEYSDGAIVPIPGRPCEECQCQKGGIRCSRVVCQQVDCLYPLQHECCSSCDGCSFGNKNYHNGDRFPDPRGVPCYECRCQHGNVTCDHLACTTPSCSHPGTVQGACCPTCTDCEYEGRHIPEGAVVPGDTYGCVKCRCKSGSMNCQPQPCPPLTCDNPRQQPGQCCPVCEDILCHYGGEQFTNEAIVPLAGHECEECRCLQGRIHCFRLDCPRVNCDYPVQETCCPSCNGCYFGGNTYNHRDRFPDPRGSACYECVCNQGNVTCDHKTCPPMTCSHPVTSPDQCCPTCTDCNYEGQLINDGDSVMLESSQCTTCRCEAGTVTCELLICPALSCSDPAPPTPGTCCSSCHACLHHGTVLAHGERATDPLDTCEECVCDAGTVRCSRSCSVPDCEHPAPGACCPVCADCLWSGRTLQNGARIINPDDVCSACVCQSGTVTCNPLPCPAPSCANPRPGPCCPVCPTTCLLAGHHLEEGREMTDPQDPCNTCTCQDGELQCSARACDTAHCAHPALDLCRCPVCHHCIFNSVPVANGATFSDDPCKSCQCQEGNVICSIIDCLPLNCIGSKVPPGQCCPVCSDCEVDGEVHHDGDVFTSLRDPCQVCMCKEGEVNCVDTECAPAQCSHPARDACCPVCADCHNGLEVIKNNTKFHLTPCESCTCQEGNITCQPVACPVLNCVRTMQVPGECCPKCLGCSDGDEDHPEMSVWRRGESSCDVCQCYQGVTLCAPAPCLTPCPHPVSLSTDHCCPVCSGCDFNGVQYQEGDNFSPTGRPCDVCECKGGSLQCYQQQCVMDILCESGHLLPPEPGHCCGECTKVSTRCEKEDVALVVRPAGNPCMTCQCTTELVFECQITSCPDLNCPESHLVRNTGTCCPQCNVCILPVDGVLVPTGSTWTDPRDPCRICNCQAGTFDCGFMTCPPVVCSEGNVLSVIDGACCPTCLEQPSDDCVYGNVTHKRDTRWRIDECTSCECGASRQVACRTQRCPPSDCSVNQSPTLVPGECCPVCITKPGTCTAFGDPHYQTFDGQLISFQGICTYVMSSDCRHGNFSVQAAHDDRGTDGAVSWVSGVTVKVGETLVNLVSRNQVLVDETLVDVPYMAPPAVFIERSGSTLIVYTKLGVKVTWDAGSGHVELSVPGSYQGALCGLCGNFNGFPQDDMTSRGGQIVTSVATFGNSWKVPVEEECQDAVDLDTCAKAGYRAKRLANTKCAPIKGSLFAACHRVVPPQAYFASCVYDLCACVDQDTCLCDVMSAYALACAQAGVTVHWRSKGRCAIGCPEDLGFVFDECGPRCPRTCENRHVIDGSVTSQCLRPCVPGCQCPAHLVLHQGRCVPEADCPAITFNDDQ